MHSFKNDGFCLAESEISEQLINFITQYTLFDEMKNFTSEGSAGGNQVPNAHSRYADPAMETILLGLQDVIEKNTSLSLYPTYSYYRIYRYGDELSPHVDRKACEISVTLSFHHSYSDSEYSWPLYINNVPVTLRAGEMAIYRGIDLPHWREKFLPPNKDDWHVQAFLHYVDANGPHSNLKYDQRSSLGVNRGV